MGVGKSPLPAALCVEQLDGPQSQRRRRLSQRVCQNPPAAAMLLDQLSSRLLQIRLILSGSLGGLTKMDGGLAVDALQHRENLFSQAIPGKFLRLIAGVAAI